MKKALSMLLAVGCIAAMSLSAFASGAPPGKYAIDVAAPGASAGYIAHIDFDTGAATRCALVSMAPLRNMRLGPLYVGDVDVSLVVTLDRGTNLGVGFGKSGYLADRASWTAGISVLDHGENQVKLSFGGFVGVSWRL